MAKMTKKPTAKKTATAKKPTAKAKPKTKTASARTTKAKGSTKASTATLKLPRATSNQRFGKPTTRRPPNTPAIPQTVLDAVNSDLNSVKNYLADYADCQKASGFLARSLRYAQTPHIKSWSFAEGKTPKLSGAAG